MNKEEVLKVLKNNFLIKSPCIWIDTFEEMTAIQLIYDAFAEIKKESLNSENNKKEFRKIEFVEWSEGFGGNKVNPDCNYLPIKAVESDNSRNMFDEEDIKPEDFITLSANPGVLLSTINAVQESKTASTHVFIIKDMPSLSSMSGNSFARMIRDMKERRMVNAQNYTPMIIISPSSGIPYTLQKLFVHIKLSLPNKKDISTIIERKYKKLEIPQEEIESIATSACGLTTIEILRAFKMSEMLNNNLDKNFILKEKIQTIQKSGILTYKEPTIKLNQIGGHNKIKKWIEEAKICMTPEAEKFGIKSPKGFISTGVPGTGKSALAEAMADYLGVPFVILDLSKIMGGIVGESEKNARQAFEVIDAIGKCVILIDECEKALGGKYFAVLSQRNWKMRLLTRN